MPYPVDNVLCECEAVMDKRRIERVWVPANVLKTTGIVFSLMY